MKNRKRIREKLGFYSYISVYATYIVPIFQPDYYYLSGELINKLTEAVCFVSFRLGGSEGSSIYTHQLVNIKWPTSFRVIECYISLLTPTTVSIPFWIGYVLSKVERFSNRFLGHLITTSAMQKKREKADEKRRIYQVRSSLYVQQQQHSSSSSFLALKSFKLTSSRHLRLRGGIYKGQKANNLFPSQPFSTTFPFVPFAFSAAAAAAADVPLAIDRSIRSANVYAIKRSDA